MKELSEDEIRRIVREEIAARKSWEDSVDGSILLALKKQSDEYGHRYDEAYKKIPWYKRWFGFPEVKVDYPSFDNFLEEVSENMKKCNAP